VDTAARAAGVRGARELDEIERALGRVPRAHRSSPYGLREIVRASVLVRDGRAYPSVVAAFSSKRNEARLYDGAFVGSACAERAAPHEPRLVGGTVTFAIHAMVGCSLSDFGGHGAFYRAFCRAIGRQDEAPSPVRLIDLAICRTVAAAGQGGLVETLLGLAPGLDVGVAYALHLGQPQALRSAAPALTALFARWFPDSWEQPPFDAEPFAATRGLIDARAAGALAWLRG
jgi:hypothetical protein